MKDHLQAGPNVFQYPGGIFAQVKQLIAAVVTGLMRTHLCGFRAEDALAAI